MTSKIVRFTDDRLGFCKYFNYAINVIEYFHRMKSESIIALNSNIVSSSSLKQQIDNWNLLFPQKAVFQYEQSNVNVNDIFDPSCLCKDFWNDLNVLRNTFYEHMSIGNCILNNSIKSFSEYNIDVNECLFLLLRGSDYFKFGISSIYSVDRLLNVARTIIKNYNLKYTYLITEDDNIKEFVNNKLSEYKNICRTYNAEESNSIKNIISYVTDIYMMSQSKYVIMTETNASLMYNIFRNFSPIFQYCSR